MAQVTFEDDTVYGFKDLHTIRPRVEPIQTRWPQVYDKAVRDGNPVWHNVEQYAQFWRDYLQGDSNAQRHAVMG